ncbi:hypothetical protein CPLU01_15278 [Colletotrichum plurivorum]|uniref:Uncharacterized protein n=1 Tax=Colletotrichum plurivorum TaxID=2175906 RepID=A0A8H6JD75_9PEZI|nr:hypothetical protein CPLU01_15278 [Colletotrichum plurivorum]
MDAIADRIVQLIAVAPDPDRQRADWEDLADFTAISDPDGLSSLHEWAYEKIAGDLRRRLLDFLAHICEDNRRTAAASRSHARHLTHLNAAADR